MRRGLTLIEVVVALAIASIIFATVFLLYRTTAATALRQQQRDRSTYAPAETFAALQRDISALMPDAIDKDAALHLIKTDVKMGEPSSDISFCAWRADSASQEGLWADAQKIAWRVIGPGTPTAQIMRLSAPLTGPNSGAIVTDLYVRGVARFRLQLHDGKQWRSQWPREGEETAGRPQSLRIDIALNDGSGTTNWTTDFAIPIGNLITSRIDRTSALAPGK